MLRSFWGILMRSTTRPVTGDTGGTGKLGALTV
jgi:hypothetical protein